MQVTITKACKAQVNEITEIYNLGIQSRLATFDLTQVPASKVATWFEQIDRYPVLVATAANQTLGWARLMPYRPRACYQPIVEYSVYLADSAQGKGVGFKLMNELLAQAKSLGYRKVVSRIFTDNKASLALCQKLGFRTVGVYYQHGQIDGQWLDVAIVEYLIDQG